MTFQKKERHPRNVHGLIMVDHNPRTGARLCSYRDMIPRTKVHFGLLVAEIFPWLKAANTARDVKMIYLSNIQ